MSEFPNEDLTVYEKAMTTGRSAEKIAHKHGFKNVLQVTEYLPEGAMVIDVGAGTSPFGEAVASLRPDITWINYDYSYNESKIQEDVSRDAPANIQYIPGDALKLDQEFAPETFDAAFSYWLFPHLSLDSIEPAQLAARAIFNVTKPSGLISIGPEMSKSRLPSIKYQKALRVIKDGSEDAGDFADMVAYRTSVRGYTRYIEKLSNEVMTNFFGTSRYFKPDGRFKQLMYDPEQDKYINPLSRRGVHLTGRLSVAAARYVGQTMRSGR